MNNHKLRSKERLFTVTEKTLLELTDEENALVKSESMDTIFEAPMRKVGEIKVVGEIVDSKCYFGVMNPGFGKPHRSCAIRCVSGGIPPVVWTESKSGATDYYIVLGKEGKAINQEVLPYVADQSCIKGLMYQYFDWKVIYADVNQDFSAISCSKENRDN